MATTQEVLDRHLGCFGAGDLDGIMEDYADDCVLFTPNGPLNDLDAIRELFVGLIADFGQPGTEFEMKLVSVVGEYAYILWAAETASDVYALGTDTFVIRDGKIIGQSFAAHATPKG
jgi:ketosteroid isomerase-like protein